jgi:hypothetical protein
VTGDGNAGENRVCLYEYRMQVAERYADLAKTALNLEYVPIKKVDRRGGSSFAKHRYLETRIYFKEFVDALRRHYPGLVSSASREIPERIHRLDNASLAHFVRGLFDAEANVREGRRIGIAMKSGLLIRQLQMLLLRFGIIASYSTYVNRFGSTMHALDISDYSSLEAFHRQIGFTAKDKQSRLRRGIANGKPPQSYHGVPVIGSWVDARAKELGIRRRQFQGITNFFHDGRGVSHPVFQRIIGLFEGELTQARGSNSTAERVQLLEDTVSQLKKLESSELMLVTVKKVQRVKNSRKERFIDIELPSTRSFIGNGFVLHNSARRYERGREMELTYFYHRVADHANRIFVEEYKVTGLIVGGPGFTKEEFLKTEFLNYNLRKNIVAVIDTAYSGREGVRELVDKAADKLQDVRLFEEKKLVQRFLGEVNKPNGVAVYGLPRIIQALDKSNVETILVADDIDTVRATATCKNCGTVKEKFVPSSKKTQAMQDIASEPCAKCGSKEFEVSETDIVDLLEERAIQVGARVEVISSGTEEGAMLKSFGGVAAFLRYKMDRV